MNMLSRRSAIVAACGSLASAASVGAWLVRGWVNDTVPAHGRRIRTSFGTVQLLASRWEAGPGDPGTGHVGTGHPGGNQPGDVLSGADLAASMDRIVVLVEVRNESRQSVRVAPGQFRLRVGEAGPVATYLLSEPHGGVVPPGRVLQIRLTYVAPPGHPALGLEYQEVGAPTSQIAALSPAGAGSAHA